MLPLICTLVTAFMEHFTNLTIMKSLTIRITKELLSILGLTENINNFQIHIIYLKININTYMHVYHTYRLNRTVTELIQL